MQTRRSRRRSYGFETFECRCLLSSVPFSQPQLIVEGTSPFYAAGMSTGDLEGDGDLDILALTFVVERPFETNYGPLIIYRNESGGPSDESPQFVTQHGSYWGVFRDVDRDGDQDIIYEEYRWSPTHSGLRDFAAGWFENTRGNGTSWNDHRIQDWDIWLIKLDVADLDGDKDLDFYTRSYPSESVSYKTGSRWYENLDGHATRLRKAEDLFQTPKSTVVWNESVSYPVDMDGDGDIDIVRTRSTEIEPKSTIPKYQSLTDWLENTSRRNAPWRQHIIRDVISRSTDFIQVTDVDADGRPDILVHRFASASFNGRDKVASTEVFFLRNGSSWGRFNVQSFPGLQEFIPADVDNDGDTDLVRSYYKRPIDDDISPLSVVWHENVNGVWKTRSVRETKDLGGILLVEDFEGDSDLDLLYRVRVGDAIKFYWLRNNLPKTRDVEILDASTKDVESFRNIEIKYSVLGPEVPRFSFVAYLSTDERWDPSDVELDGWLRIVRAVDRTGNKDRTAKIMPVKRLMLSESVSLTTASRFIVVVIQFESPILEPVDNNEAFVIPVVTATTTNKVALGFHRSTGEYKLNIAESSAVTQIGARIARWTNEWALLLKGGEPFVKQIWSGPGRMFPLLDGAPYAGDDYVAQESLWPSLARFVKLIDLAKAAGRLAREAIWLNDAFDEEGGHAANSRHYDGRAIDFDAKSPAVLSRMAGLAMLAGFDWVYHEGDHLHVSHNGTPAKISGFDLRQGFMYGFANPNRRIMSDAVFHNLNQVFLDIQNLLSPPTITTAKRQQAISKLSTLLTKLNATPTFAVKQASGVGMRKDLHSLLVYNANLLKSRLTKGQL